MVSCEPRATTFVVARFRHLSSHPPTTDISRRRIPAKTKQGRRRIRIHGDTASPHLNAPTSTYTERVNTRSQQRAFPARRPSPHLRDVVQPTTPQLARTPRNHNDEGDPTTTRGETVRTRGNSTTTNGGNGEEMEVGGK
jgi:hypothetical protein